LLFNKSDLLIKKYR